MPLTIKKAKHKDLDSVEDLYGAVCDYLSGKDFNPGWRRDCFPTGEDAADYLIKDGLYLAKKDQKLVGAVALTSDPGEEDTPEDVGEDDILYIHTLAVHPLHLEQGIGTALLDCARKQAEKRKAQAIRLWVWEYNLPAIRTYESYGFVRREETYSGIIDGQWMRSRLYELRLHKAR